jgi:hypothetical protein
MAKKKTDSNLLLWEKVMTTDKKFTKEVGFGRKFTSINAQYQVREMTREFGQIGKGWGIKDENFYMIIDGLLAYQAIFWYKDEDGIHEYPMNSSISTHNSKGKMDDEVFKKVSTDATTKAISKLGFNADIFLGLWDDNRYVSQTQQVSKPTATSTDKKPLTDTKYKAMLKAVEKGDVELVKQRAAMYELTKEQREGLNAAIKK